MPPPSRPEPGAGTPSRRPIPGRGATFNPPNRFERIHLEPMADEPAGGGEEPAAPRPTTQFYEILRLPLAVKDIFLGWLDAHEPAKKERILARLRAVKGGRLNVAEFGRRMRGTGVFGRQIDDLFHAAARRAGLNREEVTLSAAHFRRPGGAQLELF